MVCQTLPRETKLSQTLTDSLDMTNSDIHIPDKVLYSAAVKEGIF